MQLEQRNNDHKQEENDGLGLTDALPLGSGACVKRVVDVVGQHHGLLCRLTGCQREVLVEQLEGVRQRQEGADRHAGHDHRDFDFEQNAFVVTRKGGKEVILYLSDEVADALKAYLVERKEVEALPGHENAFFLSIQRRRITQRAVENMVKKYAAIAAPLKKKISPHKLRSTFGTNLYRETGDIYLVADVLGHSDVNTTRKHYAAIAEDHRRIAAQKTVLREEPVHADLPKP